MGIYAKHGFTIIETMLVLAITGMLIAALLVGVGSSISTQRYRDSVLTFKSLLQDQYAQIDNVSNDRDASWSCGSSAQPIQSGPGVAPGQSDCVLVGRYIGIVDGDISVATIVGYETSFTPGATDVEEIKNNYTLGVSTSSIERKTLEWGSVIAWPSAGTSARSPTTPRSLAVLMVRSPNSGTSYTFTSDSVTSIDDVSSPILKAMMVEGLGAFPSQGKRTICIDPNGLAVPEKSSVEISNAASGPGSIESRSAATTASLGGDTKC